MIQFRESIGFRLLVISFILLTLPLLVDAFILIQKGYNHTAASAKANLQEMAHLRELPLAGLNPLNRPLVELFVDYLDLNGNFPSDNNPELNQKLKEMADIGGFFGIYLLKITPDNRYVIVATGNPPYLGKDYTNFLRLNNLYAPENLKKGYATYLSFDDKNLHPYFIIAHPIYSLKEGKYAGAIAISEDVNEKIKALLAPAKGDYTINFALLLPSSIVFDSSDPDLRFQYFFPLLEEYKELFSLEAPLSSKKVAKAPLHVTDSQDFPFFEFTWKGEKQIGYIRTSENANYSFLAYAAKSEVFQEPLLNFFKVYTIYGVILVIGGTLATILTMRMAQPIQNLGFVMQKLQGGDMSLRYQHDPLGFEINMLGAIFNEMIDALLLQKKRAEAERIKRETLAQELRLGRQVQNSLLPQTMPNYPGVDIVQTYIPTLEVSGDFFDVFVKEENGHQKLVLAIADVSGKGVQACFYSLSVKNMLHTYVREYQDVADAMIATNNLYCKDTEQTSLFVTALCGIYDSETKILNYFSCGHNPGYVRRQNGDIETLPADTMAMGVVEFEEGASKKLELSSNDIVVFYTDGVTEAHNEKKELFGDHRLIECLKNTGAQTAVEIKDEIVNQINQFKGSQDQHDDITIIVMKVS